MKIEQIKKICQGECPICGSEDLEWFDSDNDGETITYNFQCNECHSEGWEWCTLEYNFTIANKLINKNEKLSSI